MRRDIKGKTLLSGHGQVFCACVVCLKFTVLSFQALPTSRWCTNLSYCLIFQGQLTSLYVLLLVTSSVTLCFARTLWSLWKLFAASPGTSYCCGFCWAVQGQLGLPAWASFLEKRNHLQEQLSPLLACWAHWVL